MRRPSASLIVATTALFVSLGGTGLAASHYLLTSTRQIKPAVLRELEKRGPRGQPGATGAAGATGPQGPGAIAINFTSSSNTQTAPELVKTVGPLSLFSLCADGGGTYSVDVVAATAGWTLAGEAVSSAASPIAPTPISTTPTTPTVVNAFYAGGGGPGYLTAVITNGSATYNLSIAVDSGNVQLAADEGTAPPNCTWRGTITPTSG